MSGGNIDSALDYWKISIQYLHLAQHVSALIINQGNLWCITSDHEDIDLDIYYDKTKWSDHRLGLPLLFNFYHGLELLMKGFSAFANIAPGKRHNISDHFNDVLPGLKESKLNEIIEKYLDNELIPSPLKEFISESQITINDYYQALKYPKSTRNKEFRHRPLYYNGELGVYFYEQLYGDIVLIRENLVRYGKSATNQSAQKIK